MKVVHINFSDKDGGAAIAAFRHCEAMRKAGIDATMLVLNKKSKSYPYIYPIIRNKLWNKIHIFLMYKLIEFINKHFNPWANFSYPIFSTSISKHSLVRNADIIYIHWVGNSMLSTQEIEKIFKLGKPIRWYLHDMNPITGGCHYSMDCLQYQDKCTKCPHLQNKFLNLDLSKIQFNKRVKHWSIYNNIEIYTPSNWLKSCTEKSTLWRNHKVVVFPNVFDTNKFHPVNKKCAKEILKINNSHKLILFGAAGINSAYKGWNYMREALNKLNPEIYEAIIFGNENEEVKKELKIQTHFTGFLQDELSLILIYNAADVFVSSSLADNYPNVIMEAMACGTPCVGFNTGGIPEQISHKENGYIANYKDANDLSKGIEYICNLTINEYALMSVKARDYVCKVASYEKYINYKKDFE